jgi:hypothetical protein
MFKSIAQDYFGAFEKKDIHKLRELLDSEVVLRDWNVEANGLENVLKINLEIFMAFEKIQVNVISWYAEESTVIGELIITLDDAVTMKVVDLIEFTSLRKIKSIRAYKG